MYKLFIVLPINQVTLAYFSVMNPLIYRVLRFIITLSVCKVTCFRFVDVRKLKIKYQVSLLVDRQNSNSILSLSDNIFISIYIFLTSIYLSRFTCLSISFTLTLFLYIYIYIYIFVSSVLLLPNKKVTEREITKTKVGNEIEIFITLTKYNTCQWYEGSKCC